MRDGSPEERASSRKTELIALILVPPLALLLVVAAVVTDDWYAGGAGLIFGCLGTPLYFAWLVWFVVRGNRSGSARA